MFSLSLPLSFALFRVTERLDILEWIKVPVSISEFLRTEAGAVLLAVVLLIEQRVMVPIILYLMYRVWQLEQRVLQLASRQVGVTQNQ